MRGRVFVAAGLTAAATVLAAALPAQPPQPPPQREQPAVTFKVEVNYVEVDAIVTDAGGDPVRGLSRSDFEVLEDGTPQAISVFSLVDLPIARVGPAPPDATAVEPDVATNARALDGRIYLLVLDDLHTSPSGTLRVRRAAREFADQYVGADDLVAVVETGGRADLGQDFTRSRRLVLQAIDRFVGQKPASAVIGAIDQATIQRDLPTTAPTGDPHAQEKPYNARRMLETVQSLAGRLTGVHGRRKALVLFSEGVDYDLSNPLGPDAATLVRATQDLVGAATRANVNIYAVDPRGLTAFGEEAVNVQRLATDASQDLGNAGLESEIRVSQDSLRVLADQTGGFAAVNSNDFRTAFSRIVRESSTYYVLGYHPANDARDGRLRQIEVRVRRPDLQVHARRGYVAPKGNASPPPVEVSAGTSAELRDALSSPLPVSGLTLRAFAAPFKASGRQASVVVGVRVSPQDLSFVERGDRHATELELSYVAIDENGRVQASDRRTLALDLRPEAYQMVERQGLEWLTRLTLPPGRYQLRLAGREANGRKVGSLHDDLDVPDFAQAPLAMSGLVLTSAIASYTLVVGQDPDLQRVLPAYPTTNREFVAADQLALFAEIYDNRAATPHAVDLTATVRDEAGTVVFRHEDTRRSDEIKGARGGYGYTAAIPLRGLAPGLYVLRVEARSRLGGDLVARELPFGIAAGPGGPGGL